MSTRAQTRPAQPAIHWRERTGLTLVDVENLVQADAFTEFDRLELINGRLVEMSPKGVRHEHVRNELTYFLTRAAPSDVFVSAEPQFYLANDLFRNPDILLHPRTIITSSVRGPTSLLVIEVSATSLVSDLDAKARIYAAHGVPEYWVINAWSLLTTVHRDPTPEGYGAVMEIAGNRPLVPLLAPALAVQLDQFGFNG
jgi:Uma2 family endonuclease